MDVVRHYLLTENGIYPTPIFHLRTHAAALVQDPVSMTSGERSLLMPRVGDMLALEHTAFFWARATVSRRSNSWYWTD